MPAEPPPVQLRKYLVVARRQQLTFERAWPWALSRVKWPHKTSERQEWWQALGHTRASSASDLDVPTPPKVYAAWEAAYYGEEVPGGRALERLMDALAHFDDADDHRPREVAHAPLKITPNRGITDTTAREQHERQARARIAKRAA